MKFRTELSAEQNKAQITYKDHLLFLGSCFADDMSAYFQHYRFKCTSNPFGTLYHPVAISNAIQLALNEDHPIDVIETNGLWTSYDVHSSLSRPTKESFVDNLKLKRQELKDRLVSAQFLFITLGTAHGYRHLKLDRLVANCHKIPQKEFKKELLPLNHIKSALAQITEGLQKISPSINIVFTLSPVRYLRDGFEGNQLSKSLLYVAIKDCVSKYDHVNYFPSYEYLLDDLRDYRFYDKDLVHPNKIALDYIWEKLQTTFFSAETRQILKRVENINNRLQHNLFNPETESAKVFVKDTQELIAALQNDYPAIDFGF